jgi:hypothetical protein
MASIVGSIFGRRLMWALLLWAGVSLLAPGSVLAQATPTVPSESDIYCAGFFTQRPVESGLTIQGSEDGGFKNEFVAGDYVYLSRGRDAITSPGAQYMVLRPAVDVNRREAFTGQHDVLAGLGTLYAQVAKVEVQVLHEKTSTAKILASCQTVLAGDILIPWSNQAAPAYKTPRITDQFAPSSGKATGMIAAAKEFDQWLGEGKIVYLNLGTSHGLQAGSYLRVVRPYLTGANGAFGHAARNYPTELTGSSMGRRLTPEEVASFPRETVGEVMVLSAEEGSATGIISYSRAEISVGDAVEVE